MPRSRRVLIGFTCFAAPVLLFLGVCALMGFAPFGQRSILIFDLSDQFVEFLCALKHGDVFFSWNTALGGSYIGTFSYYVSSPFSLLTLLCPDAAMPVAVVFLIALKLGLAGLTFSLLLRRRTGRYDLTVLAFSLCYALMSYNIAYAMSFMWLDGVLWLPVLLMGAEDLAEGKGARYLPWALAISFLSSWYISYMTGLFCTLYLLWRCVCNGFSLVRAFRALLRLLVRALLALALTAWLWLPTALAMRAGKLASGNAAAHFGFLWPLTTLFYKLFAPGAYDSVTYTGSAFLYCSLPAALLALGWFFLPRISRRAKAATGALLGFLLLSLWFAPLDAVWHLFQTPNSFPGRWAFVVSCFMLILGYDTLLRLLDAAKTAGVSRLLPPLLALVLAVDMTGNAFAVLRGLDRELGFESYASYRDYKTAVQPLADELRAQEGFVRAIDDVHRSRNEPAAFGYKGLTFFSSSYNGAVNDLLDELGFAQAWFWSTGLGATPVTDALLGVGWHIGSGGTAPYGYAPVLEHGGLTLYRSKFAPSPAYFTDGLPGFDGWEDADPFTRQNLLMRAVSGVEADCFLPLEVQEHMEDERGGVWTFLSDGRPIYALFPPDGSEPAALCVDGTFRTYLYTNETNRILSLGMFPAGQTVEVCLVGRAGAQVLFRVLDTDALDRALDALAARCMTVTEVGRGTLVGAVDAPADGVLYTSVPAISGWRVTVDGAVVPCNSVRGALLTVPIPAGRHIVALRYRPPGLRRGIGLGLLGLAALALLKKKKTA